jgi:hypothetical protein
MDAAGVCCLYDEFMIRINHGMNRNEIIFYFGVGVATLLNEIGIQFGYAICTFLPSMLIVGWLGFRAFPHPVP